MDFAARPADWLVDLGTGSDDPLDAPIRAIYVGAQGDVKITDIKGNDITLVALAAGVFHPVYATKVFSTGTTATGIVGVRL